MKTPLLLTAVLLLSADGESRAQGMRPWAALSAGVHSYAMGDVNDGITSLNALIAPESMGDLGPNLGFGAAVGVDLARFSVSLGYERLPATTGIDSQLGSYDYDLAANAFLGRVAYRLPVAPNFDVGLGVGGGVAVATGEFGATSISGFQPKFGGPAVQAVILGRRPEISGNGLYLEGFVQGETRVGRRLAIVPALGYRRARIEGTQRGSEGEADGTFDFSGLTARVALKLAFDVP
jgi:hypothetical protein